jgi:phage terminase large subunit GpA-like protein
MHARVNELIIAGEMAVGSTRMGKTCLIFSGYQYRIHRKNSKLISWVSVKDK